MKKLPFKKKFNYRDNLTAYIFLSPFLFIFGIFLVYPIFYSLYLSLCKKVGYKLTSLQFVGLDNYIKLFHDPEFWWSLLMTFYYSLLTIPMGIFLSLLLAIILHNKLPFKSIFRSSFFLPNVLDLLVVGIIWKLLYSSSGIIVSLLSTIGLDFTSSGLLGNPWTAMPAIAFAMVVKGSGFGMILFLAAIQNIPGSVYEAADIDGATEFDKFLHITLPLVKPVILFMVVMGTIAGLNAFTEIYAMTDNGGPVLTLTEGGRAFGATKLTGYYLFRRWQNTEYGYAAAMSYILLFVAVAISWINNKFLGEKE